jgi:SAM-dependent methyltransferase
MFAASTLHEDHFSGAAAEYARHRPAYPPRLATVLAERAPGRELALDCGCGPGQLSVLLAEHFDRVVAVDASPAQIEHAFQHPRVTYAVAPAERTGLPDRSADLVVAAQAAHWFDLPAFLAEVDRVARPGALVALVGYGRPTISGTVGEDVVDLHDRILRPHWSSRRWLVLGGYAETEFPYKEIAAPRLEMTATWSLEQLLGYLGTWSAVTRAERATGHSPLPSLSRRLADLWGNAARTRVVRWPLFVRLGRVGEPPRRTYQGSASDDPRRAATPPGLAESGGR